MAERRFRLKPRGMSSSSIPSRRQVLYLCTATFLCVIAFLPGIHSLALSAEPSAPALTNAEEVLQYYRQLQDQLQATRATIERSRQEGDAAAARNAEALAARLQTIQESLLAQRAHDVEALQNSNRLILFVAGAFAVVGLLAMMFMGYFQWRTVNRLAEMSEFGPQRALLPISGEQGTEQGPTRLLGYSAAGKSNQRLMEALDRLEKRIAELEQGGNGTHEPNPQAAQEIESGGDHDAEAVPGPSGQPDTDRLTLVLGKGQSLLSLDQTEEALACFEEVLATWPAHPETLVRKGAALEKLGRLDQASECYDAAIAADASFLLAYLYKGGLYNRLERFEEALECYEKALHTHPTAIG